MPEPNLCRHCFSVLEEGETVCSACGQKPEAPNPDAALPLGTVLSGQYRVGMVLHHNDLLTTYLAWDAEKDRKVRVEEFFPGILKRAEDHRASCSSLPRARHCSAPWPAICTTAGSA